MGGGFGGGMGGMAGSFGGGMGGMGGGMGGMGGGGFGGGMGGGMGGYPGVGGGGASDATAGLSSGGDAESAPAETPQQSPPTDTAAASSVAEPSPGTDTSPLAAEERYSQDSDTLVDLVTSTIAPQSWDTVGGPGSISYFPYSLDFVFAQTREVHEQVEELFERLRRLPPQIAAKSGATTGHHCTVPPGRSGSGGFRYLDRSDHVHDQCAGVGQRRRRRAASKAEPSRMALVVSQTAEVQDEVAKLLTMLRRHRYEALHGSRPWEASSGVGLRPAAAVIAGDEETSRRGCRTIRRPSEQNSKRCWSAASRRPASGSGDASGRPGAASESSCGWPVAGCSANCRTCTLRTEGDAAAVAWRGLRLVELGNYAEVLRRTVDVRLPWLPHRSNTELARLFDVSEMHAEEGGRVGRPSYGDAVWLRMVPAGLARDGNTYLQIAYSRAHGLPVAWESYVGGKLTARIRFSGRTKDSQQRAWRIAVQEDAQGRELARWELVESPAKAGEIPALTDGWNGYLHLDRRAEQPAIDAPLVEALTAMREFDWAKASEQLSLLADDRARHPLVRLLQAWCLENDRRIGPHDRLVGQLLEVAQSDAPDLLRFVAEGNFPSLVAGERYAILSLQPEATRTAEDCDRLADAAVAAGKHARSLAARRGGAGSRRRRRPRGRATIVGTSSCCCGWTAFGRRGGGPTVVRQDPPCGPHDLASMAELLASHAQQEPAEQLFGRAMATANSPSRNATALLRRWAAVRQGVARCEKLLEAARC